MRDTLRVTAGPHSVVNGGALLIVDECNRPLAGHWFVLVACENIMGLQPDILSWPKSLGRWALWPGWERLVWGRRVMGDGRITKGVMAALWWQFLRACAAA